LEQDKWKRVTLKNRWYDDHAGYDATRTDTIENRLRLLDERLLKNDEEGLGTAQVERFFDLFEPRS